MSNSNFLERLLNGVEVEWRALGKTLVRTKGTNITAGQMKELHKDGAPLKVYAGGKTVAYVDFGDIPAKDVNRETSIIVKSRGFIEFEFYDKPFTHKNEMWSYHSKNGVINIKYVYYYLKLNEPYFQNLGSKMQMPQIATPDTDKFQIPIPCPSKPKQSLKIQGEIVRILDAFTELTTELTTELNARKKQYNYYRDQLLSFEDVEVEWKKLGRVAIIGTGSRNTNEAVLDGKFPFFVRSQEPRAINEFEFDETAIITAGDGVGVGKVFHFVSGKYALHQRAYRIVVTHKHVSSKYLFHYIRSNFAQYLKTISVHASVTSLRMPMFEKYPVPIPFPNDPEKSSTEQNRIVAFLDRFDVLANSITEGLPREIAMRQKQYEYYRNLLFSFPKPEPESMAGG